MVLLRASRPSTGRRRLALSHAAAPSWYPGRVDHASPGEAERASRARRSPRSVVTLGRPTSSISLRTSSSQRLARELDLMRPLHETITDHTLSAGEQASGQA